MTKQNFVWVFAIALLLGCDGGTKPEDQGDSSSADGSKEKQAATDDPAGAKPSDPAGAPGGDDNRTADVDAQDVNLLRQLAFGIMNFHDASRRFPMFPAESGTPSKDLSWRVLVLPYLELQPEYKKFNLAEAWDSAQNKPLVDSPARSAFTLSNGRLICAIRHEVQPKSFAQLVDGSSNTIMLIESTEHQGDQWTQPEDLTVDEAVKMVRSLKSGESLLVAFYDGSTTKIYSPEGKDLKAGELEAIFNYKDLQPINRSVFQPSR